MQLVSLLMTCLLLPPPGSQRTWHGRRRSTGPRACDAEWEDLAGDGGCLLRHIRKVPSADAAVAATRTFASVHYRATLEDGTKIVDSRNTEPLELRVGIQPSEAVPGWDLALPRMRVGEEVELKCQPAYAFGEAGAPPRIPPQATVTFQIELIGVRDLMDSNNTENVDFLDKYTNIMADEAMKNEAASAAAKASAARQEEEEEYDPFAGISKKSKKLRKPPATDTVIDVEGAAQASPDGAGRGGEAPQVRGQRSWIPSKRNLHVQSAAGYSWRETDDEIEVRIPLDEEIAASDVAIAIQPRSLHVVVAGREVLGGVLCGTP